METRPLPWQETNDGTLPPTAPPIGGGVSALPVTVSRMVFPGVTTSPAAPQSHVAAPLLITTFRRVVTLRQTTLRGVIPVTEPE